MKLQAFAVLSFLLLSLTSALPQGKRELLQSRSNLAVHSFKNKNSAPSTPVYPSKASGDAPYSQSESTLRGSIYIPSSFGYGKNGKTPVLMVPGTAISGGMAWSDGFGKLLAQTSYADPVWINIPGNSLGDVQVTSEFVAYAINYLSAISGGCKIAVVTWSQGGDCVQWSFKYWPSTRKVVSDFVALAPDYAGTTMAIAACSGWTPWLCTPSIKQQMDDSDFIAVLRSNGGDSAYVPTTTFYTSTDEILQPESGSGATSIIKDPRHVGVTNNQVQSMCSGNIEIVTHEGVLYNAVAWALIEDALTHDGPGQASRLDLDSLCWDLTAPGLHLFSTEVDIAAAAAANVLGYFPKAFSEPAIASYAQR